MNARAVAAFALAAVACGSPPPPGAPSATVPTPTPSAEAPPSASVAACGAAVVREPGTYETVTRIRAELASTSTVEATRAILCRPSTSERAFAHGLYYLAQRHLQAHESEQALAVYRAAVDEYADPLALAKLARFHFAGAARIREEAGLELPIERDLAAASCEAWAAMAISNGLRVGEHDQELHTMVVGGVLGLVDSFETPAIRSEYDPSEHVADHEACVARYRARYESRFGALPQEPSEAPVAPVAPAGGTWTGHVTVADGESGVSIGDACTASLALEGERCRVAVTCGSRSVYPGEATRATGGFVACTRASDGATGGADWARTAEDGDPSIQLHPSRHVRVQDDAWLVELALDPPQ